MRLAGHGVVPSTQDSLSAQKCKSFIFNGVRVALVVPFPLSQDVTKLGRHTMIAMLHFATLVVTTIFAAAAAVTFHWILLRAMFVLMRPATARRVASPSRLVNGTAQLARAYASHR